ncbi:MAG: YdcF family protein [Burkholderiales bacterium]|jgi:uncharacterized SAM-binding protein YcdF (DUF218 family)
MTRLIADVLLPPLNLLLLASVAALTMRRWPRLGRSLLIAALVGGYLLSTPAITAGCLRYLERSVPGSSMASLKARAPLPAAIVALGGGTYFNAPEYGGNTVSTTTLARLRWTAHLYRGLHIPVLVSGGKPYGNRDSEAEQMRDTLGEDFGVPVQWMESRSRDTYEAAYNTWAILGEEHAQIVLVTHASHMPRAAMIFRRAGFDVIASATGYTTAPPSRIGEFVPGARGLINARIFLHEILGIGWYHLRQTFKR